MLRGDNVRRNILSLILVFTLILSIVLPGTVSRAGSVDENALDVFLMKLAGMSEDNRELGAELIRQYMRDGDEGISQLKKDLDVLAKESHKETLAKHGYTIDDVRNELDVLYGWSHDDRMLLAEYIRNGKTGSIRSLVDKYEGGSVPSTGGESVPGTEGGTTPTTGEEKPEEGKKPTVPEEKPEEKLLKVEFKDIDKHPMKDDIVFLAERGIIKGRTKDKFVPDGELTRAEFVTLISRILKLEPKNENILSFKDVKKTDWFYKTVKIAYDYNIVDGTSPTTFSPNKKVTREQMIVIIMRILNEKEITATLENTGKDIATFKDSEKISSWAVEHVTNGVKYGLFEGKSEETLNPKDAATRAEAAQMLKKLYDILNKKTAEVVGDN